MLGVSQEYQTDTVTVIVEWALAQQIDNITFSSEVSPLVPIALTGSESRQLTVSYNIKYNFSVVAVAPCGNATASITLNYGKIIHASNNIKAHVNLKHVIVIFTKIFMTLSYLTPLNKVL